MICNHNKYRGTPLRRKRHFNSLNSCRKYLAHLINEVEAIDDTSEKMDQAKIASKLCYIAVQVSGLLKDMDIEKRLKKVEEYLEQQDEFKNQN